MVEKRMFTLPRVLLGTFVVVVVCIWAWWFWCGPQTAVLVLRHADRDGSLDQLSAAGVVRAQELVHVAEKAGIAAIYHSEFQRTRQTATPLANALGLVAQQWPAADAPGLAADILQNHRGQTVLVVGHGDTVPDVIAALGGPTIPDIAGNEFDNLFVLTRCSCRWRPVRLVNLQYGAVSP